MCTNHKHKELQNMFKQGGNNETREIETVKSICIKELIFVYNLKYVYILTQDTKPSKTTRKVSAIEWKCNQN